MCSFIGQHEGKIDTRNALLYVNTLFYIALFTLLFFAATKIVPRINHHNESLSKPFEAFRNSQWTGLLDPLSRYGVS